MSGNRSRIARREARGHASMASFVHLEGQKVIPAWQQRYMDRARAGLCPRCGGELDADTKAGKVVIKGKVVRVCVVCRIKKQDWREARKKRLEEQQQEISEPTPVIEETTMATLMGERIVQATEIDKAKERFEQMKDSKILIAGVKLHNLQREARNHPRIIIWDPTDRFNGMPTVPTNVSVFMVTAICSHQVSQGLRKAAQDRRAFMFSGLITPGVIRKHLAVLLNLDKDKTHEGTSDDLGEVAMPAPAPAARLVANPQPQKVVEVPMPAPTQTAVPTAFAASTANPDAALDNAIDMLGNGIAAMQLAKEQLINAKAQLAQARDQQSKLDQENSEAARKLGALRDLLKNI